MERNLLDSDRKATYEVAKQALQLRQAIWGRSLAAQDFRHLVQQKGESLSDFMPRLNRTYQIAYSREQMSKETRDTLLYSQV